MLVLLAIAASYIIFARKKDDQIASSTAKNIPSNSPVAEYAIPANEMVGLQEKASNGDCKAAFRLAQYHMNITLHYWDALKWSRLAAKCPDVRAKETLIALLTNMRDRPEVIAETDRLISEIKEIDPARAEIIKRNLEPPRP